MMTLQEYMKRCKALSEELNKIPGYKAWSLESRASRRNEIAYAVNCKVPKEEAGLKNAFEEAWYNYLWKNAELHVEKYGDWPVYEMEEIESDDPRLDRYSEADSAEKWAADRKAKRNK